MSIFRFGACFFLGALLITLAVDAETASPTTTVSQDKIDVTELTNKLVAFKSRIDAIDDEKRERLRDLYTKLEHLL